MAAARAAPCRAALPALAPSQPRAPREVFAERSFHSSRRAQQDAPEGGAVAAAVGDGDLDGVLNDLPVVEKQFSEKVRGPACAQRVAGVVVCVCADARRGARRSRGWRTRSWR